MGSCDSFGIAPASLLPPPLMAKLGQPNHDSLRDWGHTRDDVDMQWWMLQQAQPEDCVIATGRHVSVRRFLELAAEQLA